jgi:hypothetical protein
MRVAKKSSLLQWEKILKVMLNGKPVNRVSLEAMPEMKDVPLYRLSTFIWRIKKTGGVVKLTKDGRKVDGYVLLNTAEMKEYLDNREKTFGVKKTVKTPKATKTPKAPKAPKTPKTPKKKVAKTQVVETLDDLDAKPLKNELVDDLSVEEIVDEFDSEVDDIVNDIRDNVAPF